MAIVSTVRPLGLCALLAVVPLVAAGCKRDPAPHHEHSSAPRVASSAPPIVTVEAGGQSQRVDLRTLPAEPVKGRSLVRLSRVWQAAAVASAAPARLDFVGDDGFRPGSKPRCPERLAGAVLDRGYIDPASRDLVWDDALDLPGCYRVRGVATIEAAP